MEDNEPRDLERLFAQVEDPRIERTKLHRLRDIIVTIDAIGTQTKIAEQIIEQEGEYAPVPAP